MNTSGSEFKIPHIPFAFECDLPMAILQLFVTELPFGLSTKLLPNLTNGNLVTNSRRIAIWPITLKRKRNVTTQNAHLEVMLLSL